MVNEGKGSNGGDMKAPGQRIYTGNRNRDHQPKSYKGPNGETGKDKKRRYFLNTLEKSKKER